MYHVLEHVPEPMKVLKKVYDSLSPDGILVVEVPNIDGYDMKKDSQRAAWSYDLPLHLTHYNPNSLSKFLNHCGFKTLQTDRYYPQFVLDYFNKKREPTIAKTSETNTMVTAKNTKKLSIETELIPSSLKKKFVQFILNIISRFYPGWRFTIISKKN